MAAISALVGIVGCAAGDGGTGAVTQGYGRAQVLLDRNDQNKLTVVLLNSWDIGYDFNDAPARAAFIGRMLLDQCGIPKITQTRVTKTGSTAFRQFQVFTIDVECPNGASGIVP
jgi:hypothetical protein